MKDGNDSLVSEGSSLGLWSSVVDNKSVASNGRMSQWDDDSTNESMTDSSGYAISDISSFSSDYDQEGGKIVERLSEGIFKSSEAVLGPLSSTSFAEKYIGYLTQNGYIEQEQREDNEDGDRNYAAWIIQNFFRATPPSPTVCSLSQKSSSTDDSTRGKESVDAKKCVTRYKRLQYRRDLRHTYRAESRSSNRRLGTCECFSNQALEGDFPSVFAKVKRYKRVPRYKAIGGGRYELIETGVRPVPASTCIGCRRVENSTNKVAESKTSEKAARLKHGAIENMTAKSRIGRAKSSEHSSAPPVRIKSAYKGLWCPTCLERGPASNSSRIASDTSKKKLIRRACTETNLEGNPSHVLAKGGSAHQSMENRADKREVKNERVVEANPVLVPAKPRVMRVKIMAGQSDPEEYAQMRSRGDSTMSPPNTVPVRNKANGTLSKSCSFTCSEQRSLGSAARCDLASITEHDSSDLRRSAPSEAEVAETSIREKMVSDTMCPNPTRRRGKSFDERRRSISDGKLPEDDPEPDGSIEVVSAFEQGSATSSRQIKGSIADTKAPRVRIGVFSGEECIAEEITAAVPPNCAGERNEESYVICESPERSHERKLRRFSSWVKLRRKHPVASTSKSSDDTEETIEESCDSRNSRNSSYPLGAFIAMVGSANLDTSSRNEKEHIPSSSTKAKNESPPSSNSLKDTSSEGTKVINDQSDSDEIFTKTNRRRERLWKENVCANLINNARNKRKRSGKTFSGVCQVKNLDHEPTPPPVQIPRREASKDKPETKQQKACGYSADSGSDQRQAAHKVVNLEVASERKKKKRNLWQRKSKKFDASPIDVVHEYIPEPAEEATVEDTDREDFLSPFYQLIASVVALASLAVEPTSAGDVADENVRSDGNDKSEHMKAGGGDRTQSTRVSHNENSLAKSTKPKKFKKMFSGNKFAKFSFSSGRDSRKVGPDPNTKMTTNNGSNNKQSTDAPHAGCHQVGEAKMIQVMYGESMNNVKIENTVLEGPTKRRKVMGSTAMEPLAMIAEEQDYGTTNEERRQDETARSMGDIWRASSSLLASLAIFSWSNRDDFANNKCGATPCTGSSPTGKPDEADLDSMRNKLKEVATSQPEHKTKPWRRWFRKISKRNDAGASRSAEFAQSKDRMAVEVQGQLGADRHKNQDGIEVVFVETTGAN